MSNYYVTMADENQFTFECPIFNVTTKMKSCMQLRELVWRGKEIPVRKGCQACMNSSKCPAAEIVSQISHGKGEVPDTYGSVEPVHGKLRSDVLRKILPVMINPRMVEYFGVPDAERELMETANERIEKQLATAPAGYKEVVGGTRNFQAPRQTKKAPIAKMPTPALAAAVNHAAATGDLAAAIN